MSGTCKIDLAQLSSGEQAKLMTSLVKAMAKNPADVSEIVKGVLNKDLINTLIGFAAEGISDWGSRELIETLEESFDPELVACSKKGEKNLERCRAKVKEHMAYIFNADTMLSSVDPGFRMCIKKSGSPQCKLFFADLSLSIFRGAAVYLFAFIVMLTLVYWLANKFLF